MLIFPTYITAILIDLGSATMQISLAKLSIKIRPKLIMAAFCFFALYPQALAIDTVFAGGPIKSLDLSTWTEGKIVKGIDQDQNPCVWSYEGFATQPDACRLRITLYRVKPGKLSTIFSMPPHVLADSEKKSLSKQGNAALDSMLEHGIPELRSFGTKKMLYNSYKEELRAMVEMPNGSRRCMASTQHTAQTFFLSADLLEQVTVSGCFESDKTGGQKLNKLLQQAHW